jgi:oxygen-independent coproporphyrinogen-3 oxidase
MASIYFHVPFCRQACHYCDFHFSTSTNHLEEMVQTMIEELQARVAYLNDAPVTSIYFGGGTPSLLKIEHLQRMMDNCFQRFRVTADVEVTLEANPDDLGPEKLKALRHAGVNRLSIGVQSLNDTILKQMNRAHRAADAEYAIKGAQDAGIENLTADLIFAIPGLTVDAWAEDVSTLLQMQIPHLSAYGLTIEPKTVLHRWLQAGTIKEVGAQEFEAHFRRTSEVASNFGLEQYEVSNFSKKNLHSRHNTAYWKGEHYLGIGPSAHSYDGASRQWNVANNPLYLRHWKAGEAIFEREVQTPAVACNEYLMTSLRTHWGLDLGLLKSKTEWMFGQEQVDVLNTYAERGWGAWQGERFVLNLDGWLQVDTLTAQLFVVDQQ